MRGRRSLLSLLAGAGLALAPVLGAGCRGCAAEPERAPASAAEFELPGNAPVAHGALATDPPGHEQAFIAFVAVGASDWVSACRHEPGSTPPRFTFATDAGGALEPPADGAGSTPRDRCLAARAARAAAPAGLPPDTRVTVDLVLRTP